MAFRKSVPAGVWKTVSIKGTDYDIVVVQGDHDFEKVIFRSVGSTNAIFCNLDTEIERNSAILHLDHKDRWLGVLSATVYDGYTEYFLIDLEALAENPDNGNWKVFLGGVQGGWCQAIPSTDFTIDFVKEQVVYNDTDEQGFPDGRRKSFQDCFDSSVDEREAHDKLVMQFNTSRPRDHLLRLFMTKWQDDVCWKGDGLQKIRDLLAADVTTLAVICTGNLTHSDLTLEHGTALFREIKWHVSENVMQEWRSCAPTDPMNHAIPKILFSGFIKGICEIDLTWEITFGDETTANTKRTVKVVVKQEMDKMEPQPISNQVRFNVADEKLARVTIE